MTVAKQAADEAKAKIKEEITEPLVEKKAQYWKNIKTQTKDLASSNLAQKAQDLGSEAVSYVKERPLRFGLVAGGLSALVFRSKLMSPKALVVSQALWSRRNEIQDVVEELVKHSKDLSRRLQKESERKGGKLLSEGRDIYKDFGRRGEKLGHDLSEQGSKRAEQAFEAGKAFIEALFAKGHSLKKESARTSDQVIKEARDQMHKLNHDLHRLKKDAKSAKKQVKHAYEKGAVRLGLKKEKTHPARTAFLTVSTIAAVYAAIRKK